MVKNGIAGLFIAASALIGHPAVARDGILDYASSSSKTFVTGPHCSVDPAVKLSAVVVDAKTGETLVNDNDNLRHYPASLTKMMVAYLAFEELEAGRLKPSDLLPISREAARQDPTNLGLREGDKITVANALWGMAVHSGNDAAVVLAEALGGNEASFLRQMNDEAQALKMTSTSFHNPSGLPNEQQLTSARDMATMIGALQKDFPKLFKLYFGRQTFTYPRYDKGAYKPETYENFNPLLKIGAIGKTGYTCASGHNLAVVIVRGAQEIIAVVMGGHTSASIKAYATQLLGGNSPADKPRQYVSVTAPLLKPLQAQQSPRIP